MLGHAHLWETCTVYRKTGTNSNGQPEHGPGIPARAFITRKTKTIRREGGTDIQSTAQISLPAEIIPNVQDKIMLPEGTALLVLDVSIITGAYGKYSHAVAYL